jgi:hypothetical protein
MDGLSAAASVIAVLQITESVLSACYQYYKTAKAAQKDVLEVIATVTSLRGILDTIKFLFDESDGDDPRLPLLESLDVSFTTCKSAMERIAERLGMEKNPKSSPKDLTLSFQKKLIWPWKEKEVRKILQSLENFKTIFILALNGETLQVVRAIQDSVGELSESMETSRINENRKIILNWLKPSDPSTNHNATCKKHEPDTGDWLLESSIFAGWKQAMNEILWLYGKPGAGKTVLEINGLSRGESSTGTERGAC